MLEVDVDDDELVAGGDADQCIGAGAPPTMNNVGIDARVMEAVRRERLLIIIMTRLVDAGEDRDAAASELEGSGLQIGIASEITLGYICKHIEALPEGLSLLGLRYIGRFPFPVGDAARQGGVSWEIETSGAARTAI